MQFIPSSSNTQYIFETKFMGNICNDFLSSWGVFFFGTPFIIWTSILGFILDALHLPYHNYNHNSSPSFSECLFALRPLRDHTYMVHVMSRNTFLLTRYNVVLRGHPRKGNARYRKKCMHMWACFCMIKHLLTDYEG